MMEIIAANLLDVETIKNLATEIWPIAYKNVITDEQIAFMLEKGYSVSSIQQQMQDGHVFLIIKENGVSQGFASFSPTEKLQTYKLQKLYIHPNLQGKGAGKLLITAVENEVKSLNAQQLILNVNRGNKAQYFYKKLGYNIIETVDIPYYNYVLNDYVMAKNV